MTTDPHQIREDIQSTRRELSHNVNDVIDSVRPGTVAHRQAQAVRRRLGRLSDAGQS